MEVDRRAFIKTVGVGAAFGTASVNTSATGNTWNSPGITAEDLRPHIGQQFLAICPESKNEMTLTLTKVNTNPAWERTHTGRPRPEGLRQPFSLDFEAVGEKRVEDGLYDITHPVLKNCHLFLSRNCHTGKSFEICFS